MTGLPAPDVVLDLLCCRCRQVCEAPTCECLANGLRCSGGCNCYPEKCSNRNEEEEDEEEECDQEEDSSDDEI